MNRKVWAIVFAIAAVCAVMIAWFPPTVYSQSSTAWEKTTFIYSEPAHTGWVVALIIGATILAALAVGFWTGRRR
jgi:hypothetical protein